MLGLWIEQTEGAKSWMKLVKSLKKRGVDDIVVAVEKSPTQHTWKFGHVRLAKTSDQNMP